MERAVMEKGGFLDPLIDNKGIQKACCILLNIFFPQELIIQRFPEKQPVTIPPPPISPQEKNPKPVWWSLPKITQKSTLSSSKEA